MKLALIKKENASFWRSCQSITSNLVAAYENFCQKNDHQYEIMTFKRGGDALESFDLAKKVLEGQFDQVVWLDHYPHPEGFIKGLAHQSSERELVPMVVHLFGDFILQAPLWKNAVEALEEKKLPLKLICASQKQKDLVSSLLQNAEGVEVCPFPVDSKLFRFDQERRERTRKELRLLENENIFLYTGRLSYQKNIIDLIYAFSAYKKSFDPQARLVFAGPMDDLGVPYLGKEALDGTFFFHWEEALKEHHDLAQSQAITYLGNLDHEELADLYCASDVFVSLSCHNDEDYGMAVAEALCCGLPCVLSDWGGYASFATYCPDHVQLVPVQMGEGRHSSSLAAVVKKLAASRILNNEERGSLGERAHKSLSIDDVALLLKGFYETSPADFEGFNKKFFKLCSLFENNPNAPFRGASGQYSLFYHELYRGYGQSTKEDK